ncbi:MAG: hypothetical protein JWM57_2566, partial [Phycisphaerales bacterium]|nr:hypothetical protein [Phycisphaerales bacterium]
MDDAFAGGVCRCKHCGAIQTVPRRGGTKVGKTLSGHAVGGDEPKTLYSTKSRAGMASTPSGLEELAEAVHGSGLVGSGLLNRPVPRGPQAPVAPKKSKAGLWITIGLIVLAVAVVAGYLLTRGGGETASNAAPNVANAEAKPKFAGIELAGNKVVFVLDRGDATAAFFPALRDLTVASVRSLGPNRLFQVVLWDNGSTDAYPALTAGYASTGEAEKLAKWFDTVPTGRSTDVLPALRLALAGQPDTAVLVTGKSLQLDAGFADSVLKLRPARTTIHAITL